MTKENVPVANDKMDKPEKTVKVKHLPTKENKKNKKTQQNKLLNGSNNVCRLRPTNFLLGLFIVGVTCIVIGFGLGYVTAPKPLPPLYLNVPCPTLEMMPTPIPKLAETATPTNTPTTTPTPPPTTTPPPVTTEEPRDITGELIDLIKADNIKDIFQRITSGTRNPGTYTGKEIAEWIRNNWENQGFDSSKVHSYDVTISKPKVDVGDKPSSRVSLWYGNDEVWKSSGESMPSGLTGLAINSGTPPFNAYSVSGVKQGNIMYVNYAREEDFNYIQRKYGNRIKENTMFIARLGKISIRDKVKNSEMNRGIGLIMYQDYAEHTEYTPDAYWPNPSIISRETLLSPDYAGDPSTPGLPSIAGAYRINNTDIELPRIPSTIISAQDAKYILSQVSGPKVPKFFKGEMSVKYRIGLGFTESSLFAKLEVRNRLEVATIQNVVATIKGSIEPDRFVVIGANRDAWLNDASTSGSRTATLLTVSQAFADLVKTGWRPRRTIVFCSWDAEIYGQIGSTEFTEQFRTVLNDRAVTYININSVKGNFTLDVRASPLLRDVIFNSTEKIKDPDGLYDNMFELWHDRFSDSSTGLPKMKTLRADNDVNTFVNRLGIPSMDVAYANDDFSEVPVSRTLHDTFSYVSKFIDPTFSLHKTLSETLCELVRVIADSSLIPFDVTTYARQIEENLAILRSRYGEEFYAQGVKIEYLQESVANFSKAASEFQEQITELPFNISDIPLRIINDQLLGLERAMTYPRGLPGREQITHLILGYPDDGKTSNNGGFPGLKDALAGIEDAEDIPARWRTVKHHMSVITHVINSATDIIRDVTLFMF
ncbi:putative N-acetylated-alpha-linked acidic dipeptidase [Antedon mediterranea]|uniref:putative N-acetylated-alpha-linked acidic dipeptidase n=1 Tax=Antedon mediterranea TaxID=105859 RepID=UPI003AF7D2A6